MRQWWCPRLPAGLGLVLLLLCAEGCSSWYGWQVRTTTTPVASSFYQLPLEKKPVAILPALSIASLQGTEVGMSRHLSEILKKLTPTWDVLDEQASLTGINTHGLGTEYVQMRREAGDSHLLNHESLRKLGTALGVRYIFQPRLASFTQTMTDRWTIPALDVRFSQTRSSVMRISLQLWDAESGELTWSSVSESFIEGEGVTQEPVFLEDAVRVALASMMSDFLNRRTASKYTPLNKMLDSLMRESVPTEQSPGSTEVDNNKK